MKEFACLSLLILWVVLVGCALTFSIVKINGISLTYPATLFQTAINGSIATVVCVQDDNIILVNTATLTDVPIRLLGVDTPKDFDISKKVQTISSQAASFTKQVLIKGQRVYLTFDQNRYGMLHRRLAYVWIHTERGYIMFNTLLIINGYSRYYPRYNFRSNYMKLFGAFQQYAVTYNLGMWQFTNKVNKDALLMIMYISPKTKDEYLQIKNTSNSDVNLNGWKLTSEPIDKQIFMFPNIILHAGESIYIHSGRGAKTHKLQGINVVWTKKYMWNNDGDACTLIDPVGNVIDRFKYK